MRKKLLALLLCAALLCGASLPALGAEGTADAQLSQALAAIFTPLSAFSFLVFTVLYMPCVAAFAASRRELGSWKGAILTALYQTGAAYVTALIVYQIGSLILR